MLSALAVGGGSVLSATAAAAAPALPHRGTPVTSFVISGRISCATPTSCLGIGETTASGKEAQVVAVWNGTAWRAAAIPTPKPAALINLAAVSCRSASRCVLVGASITPAGAELPYALTWNGKSLTPTAAPPLPRGSGATSLTGISCVSATSCTAVADSQGGAGAGPLLVETWNGAKWTLHTANIPGRVRIVYPGAVSCHFATFCVIVGETYTSLGGVPTMFLADWNGAGLTVMKAAVPAGAADVTLNDASCPAATFCAVAGLSSNPSGAPGFAFIEMWNGKSWTATKMATAKGGAALYGVSCRADTSCAAVGSSGPSATAQATALSYNGKTWTAQEVPGPGTGKASYFFGVNCLRAGQCVAIGETVGPGPATAVPIGGVWSGSSWRLVAA